MNEEELKELIKDIHITMEQLGMIDKKKRTKKNNQSTTTPTPKKHIVEVQLMTENNIPSEETLIKCFTLLKNRINKRKSSYEHSMNNFNFEDVIYQPIKIPIDRIKLNSNICACCQITYVCTRYRYRAKNCKRCVYCITCAHYYSSGLNQPCKVGYFDDKDSNRLCVDFDCVSRLRGTDARRCTPFNDLSMIFDLDFV